MIGRLRGTLVERGEDEVIVECGGVGYRVGVSMATLAALPDLGGEVTLRVFTHVQESRIALYGFATLEERALFDLLITVKNVGPATAVEILSGATSARDLAAAIAAGNVAVLTRIRGVGKKRADLLVVELREKCEDALVSWGGAPASPSAGGRGEGSASLLEDVVSALVHLGWRRAEAERVTGRLEVPEGATLDGLIRQALQAIRSGPA